VEVLLGDHLRVDTFNFQFALSQSTLDEGELGFWRLGRLLHCLLVRSLIVAALLKLAFA